MNPQSLQQSPRVAPVAVMAHQSNDTQARSNLATPNNAMAQLAQVARSLPPRNVNESNIEDSYVQFMFYCNPSLPLSTDTSELRKGFQQMPKTDGKTFEVFVLFELIRRLEAKEIETWSQLVVDMGVEPPDTSKNQSTQKVQQYAVRLKVNYLDLFIGPCQSLTFVP